jgi:hypothetical protein
MAQRLLNKGLVTFTEHCHMTTRSVIHASIDAMARTARVCARETRFHLHIYCADAALTLPGRPSSSEGQRPRRLREMRLQPLGPVVARTNVLLAVTAALPHFFSCGRLGFEDRFVMTMLVG